MVVSVTLPATLLEPPPGPVAAAVTNADQPGRARSLALRGTAIGPTPPSNQPARLNVRDRKLILDPIPLVERIGIDLRGAVRHVVQQGCQTIGHRQVTRSLPRRFSRILGHVLVDVFVPLSQRSSLPWILPGAADELVT